MQVNFLVIRDRLLLFSLVAAVRSCPPVLLERASRAWKFGA